MQVYIDDILITGSDVAPIDQLVLQLHKAFALKDLSTVLLLANPVLHSWTKHMELDLYFVRESDG